MPAYVDAAIPAVGTRLPLSRHLDRWIWALAGFIPSSLNKIRAIQTGERPPINGPLVHVAPRATGWKRQMHKRSVAPLRLLLSTLAMGALLLPSIAAAQSSPFDPVVDFFTALSEASHQGIRDSTTENFLVLEHGEIWNLDKLLSLVRPRTSLRRNFFSVVSEDVRGDIALVNYWNKALETSENGEERTRAWLESVVVVKRRGTWKLLQMHSTRLTPEQIPADVEFVERR